MLAESPGQPGDVVDENSLKRRMLGAAVLIALAIIFLPLVFDGSGTESQFRSIEPLQMEPPYDATILEEIALPLVDNTPVIDFVEDDQLTVAEIQDVAQQAERAQLLVTTRPVAAVAEPVPSHMQIQSNKPITIAVGLTPATQPETVTPVIAAHTQATADNANWLIQIASFRDKINALGLRSDLKNDGHPVVVKVADIAGDTIFRVFVGPIQGKNEANRVQTTLETRLKRETLLIEDN